MNKPLYNFGDIVLVHTSLIGVVVKSWVSKNGYSHEVYIRSYNSIEEFIEDEMDRFIYDKEL